MIPHMNDVGEYIDSPPKTQKCIQRPESVELDPVNPQTPTKMLTSYNLAAENVLQHNLD